MLLAFDWFSQIIKMNFLKELHSKALSEEKNYKSKVSSELFSPFKIAQRNGIYSDMANKDLEKVNLYHLGSTKDAYNLYHDKNMH